jgi:hypothetical protein
MCKVIPDFLERFKKPGKFSTSFQTKNRPHRLIIQYRSAKHYVVSTAKGKEGRSWCVLSHVGEHEEYLRVDYSDRHL